MVIYHNKDQDVFSILLPKNTFRLLLTLLKLNNMPIQMADIATAFLHTELQKIYTFIPYKVPSY
jgi:hypothetical protein